MVALIHAILLGIVEGVTEFLPVSSTGHMRLCEAVLKMDLKDPQWKLFTIFIQIGAILAVVVYFRDRILTLIRGRQPNDEILTPLEAAATASAPQGSSAAVANGGSAGVPSPGARWWAIAMILLATVPVLIVGKLADKWVEAHLESTTAIAWALGIGGILMIVIELLPLPVTTMRLEDITLWQAIGIGCAQILAVIFPGTSRSAATIMPGMLAGLNRQTSTEFSFFLAIPAMFAACGYKLFQGRHGIKLDGALLLIAGTLISFLVAWVVIAGFMNYVRRHNFIPFAVYRIVLALVVFYAARG